MLINRVWTGYDCIACQAGWRSGGQRVKAQSEMWVSKVHPGVVCFTVSAFVVSLLCTSAVAGRWVSPDCSRTRGWGSLPPNCYWWWGPFCGCFAGWDTHTGRAPSCGGSQFLFLISEHDFVFLLYFCLHPRKPGFHCLGLGLCWRCCNFKRLCLTPKKKN